VVLNVPNSNTNYVYSWIYNSNEIGQGLSYNLTSPSVNQSGTYSYQAATTDGCKAILGQVVVKIEACGIVIPESISPNGDGKNDYFAIENLELYPNTEIWIYTRWGLEVFHSSNYQNNWNGITESKLNIAGDNLPEGTYYYVLKLGGDNTLSDFGKTFKGFVYIKR
jgi:gliding motility-associated-like protein